MTVFLFTVFFSVLCSKPVGEELRSLLAVEFRKVEAEILEFTVP